MMSVEEMIPLVKLDYVLRLAECLNGYNVEAREEYYRLLIEAQKGNI